LTEFNADIEGGVEVGAAGEEEGRGEDDEEEIGREKRQRQPQNNVRLLINNKLSTNVVQTALSEQEQSLSTERNMIPGGSRGGGGTGHNKTSVTILQPISNSSRCFFPFRRKTIQKSNCYSNYDEYFSLSYFLDSRVCPRRFPRRFKKHAAETGIETPTKNKKCLSTSFFVKQNEQNEYL
jgi:hypothetical protein